VAQKNPERDFFFRDLNGKGSLFVQELDDWPQTAVSSETRQRENQLFNSWEVAQLFECKKELFGYY